MPPNEPLFDAAFGLELPRLEDKAESRDDLPNSLARQCPDLLAENRFIHGDNLRHIDHARPGEVRFALPKQEIPRGLGPLQVRGDGAQDGRLNATGVENIVLDDDVRTPETGARPARRPCVEPEYVALGDHHSFFLRTVRL